MHYSISVCIIAKNEEKHIEKCLAAIKPYPFEIVVADTGSTDKTKEIASKYTDKVLDFSWCDDFSSARNFSIAHASGEYVLILDCDEIITSIDTTKLDSIIQKFPHAVGQITMNDHYLSNQIDTTYQYLLERFFPKKFYHFEAPVHEQIVHKKNGLHYESYPLPIIVEHIGYMGTIEELRHKVERNNVLLFQELEKDKENPYLYFQIGQSYNLIYDYENSYKYYQKALEFDINPEDEWVQMMIIAYANALLHTGREADALQLEGVYDTFANTSDFLCMMGRIYMANRQYMKAMLEFVKAIHCPVTREKGTNSFLCYYNMGLINEILGNIPAALTHYRNCGDFPMALARIAELT